MSLPGLSPQNYASLLDHMMDAVVAFDGEGTLLFSNRSFDLQHGDFKQALINEVQETGGPNTSVFWREERLIKKVTLEKGFAYLISPPRGESSIAEATLRKLSKALEDSDNIYVAAVKAIHECLSWRWVAITRFRTPQRLEVLAFWDTDRKLDEYQYDLVGTPCETVVDTSRFTMYSDVAAAFPNYTALQDMGAKTYAGLVYRGADNQPLGHVMAIHDHRDVDFTLAEDVINIATLALSTHFQLHRTTVELKEAQAQIKVDGLTGIGNRHAYEDMLRNVAKQYADGLSTQWSIAIVDLDNLKPLNDTVGHNAGDDFIKLMAVELGKIGRQGDRAFRIGGDEFAMVFEQSGQVFINSLMVRFEKALQRVRMAMQFDVGASIGFACLTEASGNIDAWTTMADNRMYMDKQNKRGDLPGGSRS